jgi:heat shock protein HslJ
MNLNLTDRTFSGNSGCNNIKGKFTLMDSYLGFDKNIISTKMACVSAVESRYEKAFLSAILKVNKYTINNDELELGQGEIVLMKFKRN